MALKFSTSFAAGAVFLGLLRWLNQEGARIPQALLADHSAVARRRAAGAVDTARAECFRDGGEYSDGCN
ncbi:MAG: hypothetical protein HOM69_06675 [Gammaproteobacteria bacterium]|jgi:hypothetical protein|nr:hypothetical protein [Gammaproteobacteria bacterium]